jgi:hypothetical protein
MIYQTIRVTTAAVAISVLSMTSAMAGEGKGPNDAIEQNVDKNGAFSPVAGNGNPNDNGPNMSNGVVNFGLKNAINNANGQGGANANENSAVSTQTGGFTVGQQRVEPRGLYSED